MKIVLPIILVVIYTFGLLYAGSFSKKLGLSVSENSFVNGQINYQIVLLIITVICLLTTYLMNKESFLNYFSFGQISATGDEMKIFGIKQGDSWLKTGLSLCFVITGVTAIFMYFQVKNSGVDWSILQTGILWVLLFSLSNSFGEEMIYRLGIVSPLKGLLTPLVISIISAVLFGLAHINGMPNGITGVLLAGILGFVLAKSVMETNGFFWAWVIHFLQDVVIIGALFMLNNK